MDRSFEAGDHCEIKTRLTIAMVTDDFLPANTGAGMHDQKMATELVRRGHDVLVITSRHRGQPEIETLPFVPSIYGANGGEFPASFTSVSWAACSQTDQICWSYLSRQKSLEINGTTSSHKHRQNIPPPIASDRSSRAEPGAQNGASMLGQSISTSVNMLNVTNRAKK